MNYLYIIGLIGTLAAVCNAKGTHKVHCTPDLMRVEISLPANNANTRVYLEGMKTYPNQKCHPTITESLAEFQLSLKDIYECGVTRVVNKITGKKVYYHKIIIEGDAEFGKEIVSVKCITTTSMVQNGTNHSISRRDTLPIGFQEPETLDIITSHIGKAPEPILGVGVRQNGELVSGELNVSPGTPLSMEIFLDKESSPVYGLGVTHMQVTDMNTQEETIIFNSCSVDPFLFENFNTVDGDFLTAKFRAFKFPDSTYVQFRGTVNVCLDKCNGIQCSNGQTGFGRKKRELSNADPNKIYVVSMTTYVKFDSEADPETLSELEQKIKQLKITNQKLARNSRGSVFEPTVKETNGMERFQSTSLVTDSSVETADVEETSKFDVISMDLKNTDSTINATKSTTNSAAILSYRTGTSILALSIASYMYRFIL